MKNGREALQIERHDFPGLREDRILLVGGVHGSERAGVEVVRRVLGTLSTASPRRFTVTVLPVLFPLGFARAEQEARSHGFNPWLSPDPATGRTTILSGGAERDPNRNFPPVGYCHSASEGRDQFGYPIADENIFLQDLIAELSPVAIVSVHCIRVTGPVAPDMRGRIALPGIFADPPTVLPLHITRDRPDMMPLESDADRLAITAARFVSSRQTEHDTGKQLSGHRRALHENWVSGNWLTASVPTSRYARQRDMDSGVSLGEWASRPVTQTPHSACVRNGIPVFTMEVRRYYCSYDYHPLLAASTPEAHSRLNSEYNSRVTELQAHADAITEVLLQWPVKTVVEN